MSSKEHLPADKMRPCIDLVDFLRTMTLGQDVALPSIAVIGGKNSGKTSVLEALSGVRLPRGRNHVLVLQMNKTKGGELAGVVKDRRYMPPTEQRICPQNREDVLEFLRRRANINSSVARADLVLEISSPDVPDLTLVDLPSIPEMISDKIKTGIKRIITNPECIILMVVPCNVDIATTEAFKLIQEVDPNGERTLGLMTKPDIVIKDKEKTLVDTVENKVIKLKKGFMVVRCYDQTKVSLMDPIEREVKFFKEHHLFKSLYDGGHATLPKLAEKLSQELAQHIEEYLPQLKQYVKKTLLEANAAMMRIGKPPPSDTTDKWTYLANKMRTFIQDVMRLTTGELLDLTDKRVFSVWRNIVKDSEESFQCKLEAAVALPEQSGFSNFQTFDHVIKDQIRLLKEPAVFTLSNSAETVKKALLKLMESVFFGFPKFINRAENVISDVMSRNQKAAESSLRTHFEMEEFEVYAEERMWTNKKREKKSGSTAQLYSYYQTICQRLTSQIPMTIRFYMFNELSSELQKNMLQMFEDKVLDFVEYDQKLRTQTEHFQKCFIPLKKAQIMLSEL